MLEGSKISETTSYPKPKAQRKELKKLGIIANNRFVDDYEFSSPSGASNFVSGGNTNGWDFWIRDDGTTLGKFYRGY